MIGNGGRSARFQGSAQGPTGTSGPAFALYAAAVAAAREPWFYQALGVPDTLDGRFDLVALHAFLLIHRLQAAPDPGPALAQAVFDAMFSDMDNNLREIGVSDLRVGKRVRAMWEAFHGRAKAYASADRGRGPRRRWRRRSHATSGAARHPDGCGRSAGRVVLAQAANIWPTSHSPTLAAGEVQFLPAPEAVR